MGGFRDKGKGRLSKALLSAEEVAEYFGVGGPRFTSGARRGASCA